MEADSPVEPDANRVAKGWVIREWAVRHRRYDPGSVTALLTLTPVESASPCS
jgi:hypothetical protein